MNRCEAASVARCLRTCEKRRHKGRIDKRILEMNANASTDNEQEQNANEQSTEVAIRLVAEDKCARQQTGDRQSDAGRQPFGAQDALTDVQSSTSEHNQSAHCDLDV